MIDVPVQVKDALRDGRLKKNYRFVVLNEDGTESEIGTIDNNNLVSESVSIDERMCSGDTLKFGLCEGSSLEFQYFGKPNITGKRVQAFIDVDYGEAEPYTIPMGFFDVQKCSRQASTGIIKVTAYNKLQSDYLDAKANDLIDEEFPMNSVTLFDLERWLLKNYQINKPSSYEYPAIEEDYIVNLPFGNEYLQSQTSDATPICWPNMRSISISYPLFFRIRSKTLSISPPIFETALRYFDAFKYSLKQMSYDFVNNLKTLIDLSQLNVSGDYFIGHIQDAPNEGWRHIFSIEVDYGTYKEYYADYPVLEDKQGGYTFNGTIDDFSKVAIKNNPVPTVKIYIPYSLLWTGYGSDPSYANPVADTREVYFWNQTSYLNRQQQRAYYTHYWKYPDGTDITVGEYPRDPDNALRRWVRIAGYFSVAPQDLITVNPHDLPDTTLRDTINSTYELSCQFGQLSRLTDLFSGVELNRSALYPADTLYPENSLYPDGAQESSFRSQYSKLWADEGNVHKWRNLIITYKGLDENQQPKDFTLQRQVNADGTDDYNCSDNWLFRNLVWTSEQIAEYADAMVAKMQPITWFPFEMWAAGLPYLETGDQIEIPLGEETYTSYILQRNLKGIQNLQDTYINGTLDIF